MKDQKPSQSTTTEQVSLAESRLKRIMLENLNRLRSELSSDDSVAKIANALIAFLDRGGEQVLVHNRKNHRKIHADSFDVWYENLRIASPADHEKHVRSYAGSADGLLLLPYLDEIRSSAIEMGIKWDRAETLFREVVQGYRDEFAPSQSSAKTASRNDPIPRPVLEGERDPVVAARRAELRKLLLGGRRPSGRDICQTWDEAGIPVPKTWDPEQAGIKWTQALRMFPNRAHKLIASDVGKVRQRTK